MATQSGNWIKMRVDLQSHPKVVRMASALRADKKPAVKRDRLAVVGALHAVWSLFDAHTEDGILDGYSLESLDEEIGWRGFSAALVAVRWLDETDDGLSLPEFEEHNGASAKRRAQETKRKRIERNQNQDDLRTDIGQMSAFDADVLQTREREEKEKREIPPNPPRGQGRFAEFWEAWPASTRKGGKAECAKVWGTKALDAQADTILGHVRRMRASHDWTKDGGQFIPAPVVYLRAGRWDGAELGAANQPMADVFAGAR